MEEKCQVEELEDEFENRLEENQKLEEYLDFLEDVMVCTNCSEKLKKQKPVSKWGWGTASKEETKGSEDKGWASPMVFGIIWTVT